METPRAYMETLATTAGITLPTTTDALIGIATMRTSDAYGDKKNYAIALMAMHMLVGGGNAGENGAGGQIIGESEGKLSRQYAKMDGGQNDAWLNTTFYGAQLVNLRISNISGVRPNACGGVFY